MSLAENRKARFNYEILEEYEAGIVLSGAEVKSLRKGQASLDGSFITFQSGSPVLVGMHISPYQPNNPSSAGNPRRERKLLLGKRQINELLGQTKGGYTVVPLSVYAKGKLIKARIALVRGKKKHDKRETMKKRDADREIRRVMGRK